jgi:hypothetical protein
LPTAGVSSAAESAAIVACIPWNCGAFPLSSSHQDFEPTFETSASRRKELPTDRLLPPGNPELEIQPLARFAPRVRWHVRLFSAFFGAEKRLALPKSASYPEASPAS